MAELYSTIWMISGGLFTFLLIDTWAVSTSQVLELKLL